MSYDRALVLFLLGMLIYRAIDLGASKAKLEQALCRARRMIKRLPEGTSPKQFFPAYREFNGRLEPREFQVLAFWCRVASTISREFIFLLMCGCILILLFLGLSLIATHSDRSASTSNTILAIATLLASLTNSVAVLLLERLRLRLERI
jgi:hypothetical protein